MGIKIPGQLNGLALRSKCFSMTMFFDKRSFLFKVLFSAASVLVFLGRTPPAHAQQSALQQEAYRAALAQTVLLRNEGGLIPLKRLDSLRIGLLRLGQGGGTGIFQDFLEKYSVADVITLPEDAGESAIAEQLAAYNLLIFCFQDGPAAPSPGTAGQVALKLALGKQKVILAVFDPAQYFVELAAAGSADGLLVASGDFYGQSLAAQLIFGGVSSSARLAVDLGPGFPAGAGMDSPAAVRLGYAPPEIAGLNGQLLRDSIEAIIEAGRANFAYPGAQVLVAKDNKIVYHQAFGNHTYEESRPVGLDDLYDFASVTKISAGLPALMEWYGQGRFDPDAPLSRYLPETRGSNKADLSMRRILTHTARLMAWIPFWRGTLKGQSRNPWQKGWNGTRDNDFRFKARTFRSDSSSVYPVFVTDSLWLHRRYDRLIFRSIYRSPLNEKPGFVYSDFFFYTVPRIVRYQTGIDFETYLKTRFYRPLGAHTLTLNPLRFYPSTRIVPTERDTFFRMKLLHGTVHDEGAAMLGGISGHAGLFGSANDLAKLMQMYLNFGTYGGERFIEESALREFTRCQYCDEGIHRGLGFDKPTLKYNPAAASYASQASPRSFGHTGFTGTYTWADPERRLLVIIFTNRVYPTRQSRQLLDMGIRRRVHEVVYSAIQN